VLFSADEIWVTLLSSAFGETPFLFGNSQLLQPNRQVPAVGAITQN
jgi:hypothetical protein